MAKKIKEENVEAVEEVIETPIEEAVEEVVEEAPKQKTTKSSKIQNGIAGEYKAACMLNLRATAVSDGEIIVIMPEGTVVNADGKVSKKDGNDWYSVTTSIKGKDYSGFCVGSFLTK